ncbi:MAG: hypothetical protein AB7U61_16415, partial [Methylocystis sp.]
TVADFRDRINSTLDRRGKLYVIIAGIADRWPTLPSIKRWRALERPGALRGPSSNATKKKPPDLPVGQEPEIEKFLEEQGRLGKKFNAKDVQKVVADFGWYVALRRANTLRFERRERGERRAKE